MPLDTLPSSLSSLTGAELCAHDVNAHLGFVGRETFLSLARALVVHPDWQNPAISRRLISELIDMAPAEDAEANTIKTHFPTQFLVTLDYVSPLPEWAISSLSTLLLNPERPDRRARFLAIPTIALGPQSGAYLESHRTAYMLGSFAPHYAICTYEVPQRALLEKIVLEIPKMPHQEAIRTAHDFCWHLARSLDSTTLLPLAPFLDPAVLPSLVQVVEHQVIRQYGLFPEPPVIPSGDQATPLFRNFQLHTISIATLQAMVSLDRLSETPGLYAKLLGPSFSELLATYPAPELAKLFSAHPKLRTHILPTLARRASVHI